MTKTVNIAGYHPLAVYANRSVGLKDVTTNTPFKNAVTVDLSYIPGISYMHGLSAEEQYYKYNSYDYMFWYSNNLTTVTNMNTATTSLIYTFYCCKNLVNIPTLPNSVTEMSYTFYGCSNLTTPPVLPGSVINMSGCFMSTNLTSAPTIPNTVQRMDSAFQLTNIIIAPTIPDSVIDMSSAFKNCSNLNIETICLPNNPNLNTARLTDTYTNLTTLRRINISRAQSLGGFFSNCTDLTTVDQTFWNSFNINQSQIVNLHNAFLCCNNLTTLAYIPNNVQDIRSLCFNCPNITTVARSAIPAGITNIANAFYNCPNLTGDIYISAANITNAAGAFYNANPNVAKTVYIPFNTNTYNAFIAANYTTDGSYQNIYLRDINTAN